MLLWVKIANVVYEMKIQANGAPAKDTGLPLDAQCSEVLRTRRRTVEQGCKPGKVDKRIYGR